MATPSVHQGGARTPMGLLKGKKEEIITDEYAEEPLEEEISEDLIKEIEAKEVKISDEEKEKLIKEAEDKDRRKRRGEKTTEERISEWVPKTKLGKQVKSGGIKDINKILDGKVKILEAEIVDSLLNLNSDLIAIGQSKGKFGGGKRRAWRQTQRKTKEGNVPTFSTMAVIGDGNGHIGIGTGKAMETLPARDKAIRKAKLNVIHIKRGCAGFDCACDEDHTVPFEVNGKSGSVGVTLIPAAQGTGLVVADHLKKILTMAGIKDIYSRTTGRKRTTFNLVKACMNALKKTNPEVYK